MTSPIEVDFGELSAASSAMSTTLTELEQLHADLTQRLDPVFANWTGDAAEAYRRAQDEWNVAAADLRRLLGELRDLVDVAHGNHASAVRTNTAMWQV